MGSALFSFPNLEYYPAVSVAVEGSLVAAVGVGVLTVVAATEELC